MHTVVQSASKTVTIGHDQPFVIIGERINPTGRKKFQELLRAGDLSTIAVDVESQIKGGADMLDVNMGVPLTDEPALLSKAIKMIQGMTDMPICIDSSVIEALQAGVEIVVPSLSVDLSNIFGATYTPLFATTFTAAASCSAVDV